MSEDFGSRARDCDVLDDSKWVKGLCGDMAVGEVAFRVLSARLTTVWHWLPLAAEKSDENTEYVHQLRVATRRAMQGVRIFSNLLPEGSGEDLRALLRRIRIAADAARNWDVLSHWFLDCDRVHGVAVTVSAWIQRQRQEAQPQMVAIHEELKTTGLTEQFERLVREVLCQGRGKAKRTFGRQAGRYLRPVVKKFFLAAEGDLSSDETIHELRISTKKLRYTMEIVAAAFPPAFREKLYPQVNLLQDRLGCINDHAMARTLLRGWSAEALEAQPSAFLEGLLLAEARAHQDLREAFLAVWTPDALSDLRRRFRRYCPGG